MSDDSRSYTVLDAVPDLMALYRGAMRDLVPGLGAKRSGTDLPVGGYEVRDVTVDPSHLAAYCRTTGLRLANELPATYPYVLTFPVVMKLMTAPDFPFRAVGTVHLSCDVEQRRPLTVAETLTFRVHAENLRRHRRGTLVDLVAEVLVDGEAEPVWRQTSGFLAMGKKAKEGEKTDDGRLLPAPAGVPEIAPTAQWRVTPRDIRAYADASGDKNPIHVSKAGAKALGFPATIAHGMWSAAAALAGLEGRLPADGALRYRVDFAKPVILPATVGYWAAADGDARDIELRAARKPEKLHMHGRLSPLEG